MMRSRVKVTSMLLVLIFSLTGLCSAKDNKPPRLLANRRSSAKALMTEPDIAHVVKEILGARVVYIFACLYLAR